MIVRPQKKILPLIWKDRYDPILKSKSFEPDPIARHGIPDYANSVKNPHVKNTSAYIEFWNEQIRRCLFGYNTGGQFISGRHYFYMNFTWMSTVGKGTHNPGYIDLDHEFFSLVEYAKQDYYGVIVGKARRKGLSFKVAGVIDHGLTFGDKYEAGVAAGVDDHVTDFVLKFEFSNTRKVPEMQLHYLKDNTDLKIAGWQEKNAEGKWMKRGSFNTMYLETMFNNPNKFKGKKLEDCVFEEAGEFDNLLATYQATKACFMDGNQMVGTSFVYGTGGNIKNESKGFMEMWHNNESYRLIRWQVMAPRLYFPCVSGSTNKYGENNEQIPNLIEKYPEPYMRVGMEDVKEADFLLREERAILMKNPNKKDYYEHLQNYPMNDREMFTTYANNHFSTEILNNQIFTSLSNVRSKYKRYRPEYATSKDGKAVLKSSVVMVPVPDEDPSDEFVYILNDGMPVAGYKRLFVAGIDSYDLDQSSTSKSLGSMVVIRGDTKDPNMSSREPVALIFCRPKRKEKFYNLCLMTSIFYNLIGDALIDVANPLIIQHFKDNGGTKYLAKRPQSIESETSEQQHVFGVKLTAASKPKMLGLMQTHIEDHGHKIHFIPLLEDLLAYDETAIRSDWDSADAYGIALIRLHDRTLGATKDDGDTKSETIEYMEDVHGNIIPTMRPVGEKESEDPLMRMLQNGSIHGNQMDYENHF